MEIEPPGGPCGLGWCVARGRRNEGRRSGEKRRRAGGFRIVLRARLKQARRLRTSHLQPTGRGFEEGDPVALPVWVRESRGSRWPPRFGCAAGLVQDRRCRVYRMLARWFCFFFADGERAARGIVASRVRGWRMSRYEESCGFFDRGEDGEGMGMPMRPHRGFISVGLPFSGKKELGRGSAVRSAALTGPAREGEVAACFRGSGRPLPRSAMGRRAGGAHALAWFC